MSKAPSINAPKLNTIIFYMISLLVTNYSRCPARMRDTAAFLANMALKPRQIQDGPSLSTSTYNHGSDYNTTKAESGVAKTKDPVTKMMVEQA